MAQTPLDDLLKRIAACRICRDNPSGAALPHEPRPVLRVSASARICVCGQAPGTRVHASGKPFTDPSGVRLRDWMGVDEEEFYDPTRVAIVPMGFCFPGLDNKGGDRPPRRECREAWHDQLFNLLPRLELLLLVGRYAQVWHLKKLGLDPGPNLTQTVANWRDLSALPASVAGIVPLPHPSWRNNAWIKNNPWFATELIPVLRDRVRAALQ